MKEAETKINVSLRIIPFGHASIEMRGHEEEKEIREKDFFKKITHLKREKLL